MVLLSLFLAVFFHILGANEENMSHMRQLSDEKDGKKIRNQPEMIESDRLLVSVNQLESIFPRYQKLKVAIAHHWFITWRGGEKVARAMLDLFPNADIYTLFYDEKVCGKYLEGHSITSSYLDKPLLRKHYKKLFPLYPSAIRSLNTKKTYDLILSIESGPIKGISTHGIPHLCYINTPMRYSWEHTHEYLENITNPLVRRIAAREFKRLKKYDITTIENVDKYVANSRNIQDRVKRYYDRESSVVFPPVNPELFTDDSVLEKRNRIYKSQKNPYFISFGAITPYKRIDLLVSAFNKNGKQLVVIGEGEDRAKLEKLAKENITFIGSLIWSKIEEYILGAEALVFPGEEDFGIIPVEIMSYGVPVIAYGKGGLLETVIDKSTGLFFPEQTIEAVEKVLCHFEAVKEQFDPEFIREHARSFHELEFKKGLLKNIKELLDE